MILSTFKKLGQSFLSKKGNDFGR